MPRRTALIVEVPEAEPAVGALRLRHDSSAERGVPAHITVLFPFVPPETVDDDAIAALVAAQSAFDYRLVSVETFPNGLVTYLAPVPWEPFRELTSAFVHRWPDHPPYEGAHETVIPHLTISDSGRLDPNLTLPITAHAHEVTLIEEGDDGHWAERARFALGPAP